MAVSNLHIEISTDRSVKPANGQRTANSMVITEVKSSSVGVDWYMIRTVRDKGPHMEDND